MKAGTPVDTSVAPTEYKAVNDLDRELYEKYVLNAGSEKKE